MYCVSLLPSTTIVYYSYCKILYILVSGTMTLVLHYRINDQSIIVLK